MREISNDAAGRLCAALYSRGADLLHASGEFYRQHSDGHALDGSRLADVEINAKAVLDALEHYRQARQTALRLRAFASPGLRAEDVLPDGYEPARTLPCQRDDGPGEAA